MRRGPITKNLREEDNMYEKGYTQNRITHERLRVFQGLLKQLAPEFHEKRPTLLNATRRINEELAAKGEIFRINVSHLREELAAGIVTEAWEPECQPTPGGRLNGMARVCAELAEIRDVLARLTLRIQKLEGHSDSSPAAEAVTSNGY